MIARVLRTAALLVVLTSTRPGAGDLDVLRDIGFDQHLAAMLPLAARFTDEQGKSAPLAQFLDGRPAILRRAVGFRYRYAAAEHQLVRPAGSVVVAPSGRVARYFCGVDFPPDQLRTSLLDAGRDRIASPVERLLLLCFHYDPETGKYSAT